MYHQSFYCLSIFIFYKPYHSHVILQTNHSYPGRFWCFTRLVYMSMAYLYGKKFVGPITTTILALRDDLYNTAYEKVNWDKARHSCAKVRLLVSFF
jgi:hypothetical protein